MDPKALENVANETPFAPFNLTTASGGKFHVPHPDFFHLAPNKMTCLVYAADGGRYTTLAVPSITEIEPAEPQKGPPARRAE